MCVCVCVSSAPSTFGLDRDGVINQYITTLLLQEEEGAGDAAPAHGENPALGQADALERALEVIPMLRSTSDLVISLSAAMLKVRVLPAV